MWVGIHSEDMANECLLLLADLLTYVADVDLVRDNEGSKEQ